MKRRILSIILLTMMGLMLFAPASVNAAEVSSQKDIVVDSYAIPDLVYGDTYGIYPLTWYAKGLTKPVTISNLEVLFAGLRNKILDSGEVIHTKDVLPDVKEAMTVEEVIHAYGIILSNYKYTKDIYDISPDYSVEFMKKQGVYTGKNGEQGLKEKCSLEQAMVMATRIVTYVYHSLDAASKGFLWQVNAGNNTVYLLGSIHVASHSIYPFGQAILEAYQSAQALVVEADIYNQREMAAYSRLAVYTDQTTLKDHIPADLYQKTIEICTKLGISESIAAYMKPWYLSFVFGNYAIAGKDESDELVANLGIDISFLNDAHTNQKPILEIEGLSQQAKIIDGFSGGLQEYLLADSIHAVNLLLGESTSPDMTDQNDLTDRMLACWHDGNVDAFRMMTRTGGTGKDNETAAFDETMQYLKEYQDKLIHQRDVGMADYIDKLLNTQTPHTFFVVVGAGHFISDYSVLDILKEKGYEITQIK